MLHLDPQSDNPLGRLPTAIARKSDLMLAAVPPLQSSTSVRSCIHPTWHDFHLVVTLPKSCLLTLRAV